MEQLASALDHWLALAVTLLCLALSALFSGSQSALTAASRARLHALLANGDPRASAVTKLLAARERLIGTLLIGRNISKVCAVALITGVLAEEFGRSGVFYSAVFMSVVIIVFAEILPKTIAIASPDQVALWLARIIAFFVLIFGPLARAGNAFARLLLRPFGVTIGEHEAVLSAHEELRGQVDLMHREGGVARTDRDMFGGLLDIKDLSVSDVMIHRTKMRTINADLPPEELVREILGSPYTRVPLWRGEPENIIGVLHAKDLLRSLDKARGDARQVNVAEIALDAWFTPQSTHLQDQLQAFLKRKTHFALVVDEYGEVMGLVTLEDILEEIVGDIRDEHDVAMQGVRPQPDGSVNVDGSVSIRDLNRVMDWSLPDEEATTIAGLVIHEAQAIPEAGQIFTFHGFRFDVLRKSRNRITVLRIRAVSPASEPDERG